MKRILTYTFCCMICMTQSFNMCYGGLFSKKPTPTIELVKENWTKQKQLGTSSIAKNLQDLIDEFILSYNDTDGLRVDKALSTFLKGKNLKRSQIRTLTNIVINGKLKDNDGKTVNANGVEIDVDANDSVNNSETQNNDNTKEKVKKKANKDKKGKKSKKKRTVDFNTVKANWQKQTEQWLDVIPNKLQEAMNSFINEYQDDGSSIGKALSDYLGKQGLNRAQKKRLKSIVLNGKIVTTDVDEDEVSEKKKKKKKRANVNKYDDDDEEDIKSQVENKPKKKRSVKKSKLKCKPTLGSIKRNWTKQQEIGVNFLPEASREAMDQFVRQYADIVKLLNDFLTEKGLDKEQKKQLTSIVLNGQFIRDN